MPRWRAASCGVYDADLAASYGEALKQFDAADPNTGKVVDKLVKGIDRPASEGMQAVVGQIETRFAQRIEGQIGEISALSEQSKLQFTLFVGLGVLGAAILSFLLLRDLMHRLGGEPAYVAEIAHNVADGNLALVIQVDRDDRSACWPA